MINVRRLLMCFLAFASAAYAENAIDGKWEARFPEPQGGQIAVVFDLKTHGETVEGTVSNWRGAEQLHKVSVQNGKIQGHTLTFDTMQPVPLLFNKTLRQFATVVWYWGTPLNSISGIVTTERVTFTQRDWKGDAMQFQAERVK